MLISPLWNLFFLTGLIGMMCYAYYSRHEHVQKLALVILGIYITSQFAIHTEFMYATYAGFDLVGLTYCTYLSIRDPMQKVTKWMMWIFIAMSFLHVWRYVEDLPWLQYQIAGNALFLAQLAALCFYGKRYGLISRAESSERRSDPYYRMLTTCRLMLKT